MFIHVYVCEVTDSPTERIENMSNTNHFCSASDNLGREYIICKLSVCHQCVPLKYRINNI